MSSAEPEQAPLQTPWRQRANAICRGLRPYVGINDPPATKPHGFLQELPHLLLSALFIASVVHLLHGLTVPLELPARLVVSNVAAHWLAGHGAGRYPEDDDFALLKIDSATFRDKDRYGGSSPLDRCKLSEDLSKIVGQLDGLERLGIDFDLSPTGKLDQDKCAGDILALLKSRPKIVTTLILPVDPDDREQSAAWRKAVAESRVQLADPELDVQFGMARQHRDDGQNCPSLGVALGRELPQPDRQGRCMKDLAGSPSGHHDRFNIAFHRLALLKHRPQMVSAKDVEPFEQQLLALKGKGVKRVMFGPGYDRSDEFLTPLGLLNGVDVHAAIALEPRERHDGRLDFVIDVILGVAFGALVHRLWKRYFDQRLDRSRLSGQPRMAYKWLLLLVGLLALAILLVLPAASTVVTVVWGWWISPVPMLIGMTVDALVTGSVAAAIDRHEHPPAAMDESAATAHDRAPPAVIPPNTLQVLGLHLPALLWFFIVGWALISMLPGDAP